jgi:hypothetical protein
MAKMVRNLEKVASFFAVRKEKTVLMQVREGKNEEIITVKCKEDARLILSKCCFMLGFFSRRIWDMKRKKFIYFFEFFVFGCLRNNSLSP